MSHPAMWSWMPSELVSPAPSKASLGNFPSASGLQGEPSVIEKQQRELELLIQELKDRDRCYNEATALCSVSIPFHHAWF